MGNTIASPANLDLLFFGNECNLSCRHCFYKEGGVSASPKGIAHDLETARMIVRRHPDSSVFLYPVEITTSMEAAELFPLVCQTKVLTNGVALDEKRLDRLMGAGIKEMKITLCADHETHALFNDIGAAQYKMLLENIGMCVNKGIRVIVSAVVSRSTVPKIPKLIALCVGLGVGRVEFLRLKPVGNAKHSFMHELPEKAELMHAVETIERLKRRYPEIYLGYGTSFGPDFSGKTSEEVYAKIASRTTAWEGTRFLCPSIGQTYYGLSLQSGKMYGCLFMMEEDDFLLGTMNMETGDIDLRTKDFLDPATLSAKLRGICAKDACEYHPLCLGGCRSTAYLFAKQNGDPDPLYAGMDFCVTRCKDKPGL